MAHASKNTLIENLKVWYTNADSLRGKLTELSARIQAEDPPPDIIVITETWPKHSRYTGEEFEYKLKGYDLHRTALDAERDICIPLHQGDKLILCAIYRSPNSEDINNDKMYELLEEIQSIRSSHKLILGDFNFPGIYWSELRGTDRRSEKFIEVIESLYLIQHVKEATRTRGTNVPSILDLVFTEDEGNIEHITYDSPLGKSDTAC